MADAIPADDLLFGISFGEEMKKATTLVKKSFQGYVKVSLVISKKVQQPIKQTQGTCSQGTKPENAHASTARSATRRARALSSSRRHNSRSKETINANQVKIDYHLFSPSGDKSRRTREF